ncbi:MAG: hypothetical protein E6995_14765 [Enterobacteriaceae bacterium]|uniref:hypothetical protein n=1 Tax=Hafnia paralvei TaxID=546367 RepID=UPI00187D4695|nr:hypothetical protein [Hafnia paralvei]MDU1193391.1 hypothetical protein [Enterobacteriaceae bacterium]MDU1245486.1 hypothetical protein [Enterobacteriaceae bacterium]
MKKLEDRKNFPRRFEMASAPPQRGAKALSKEASETRIKEFNDAIISMENYLRIKK